MLRNLQVLFGAIFIVLSTSFITTNNNGNKSSSNKPLSLVKSGMSPEALFQLKHPKRELRSAWITTFTNLDWPSKRGLSSEEQKAELIRILNDFQKNSINCVIFQVRAAADAFYKSDIVPWSEWLTGTQGKAPDSNFDPLAFIVDECHKRNMELHAWFNPFRAVSHVKFSSVAKNHVSKTKPFWFFKYGNSKYFNPGLKAVREHISAVVAEVVKNYDIDGIHFDDYFYPYSIKGESIPDDTIFSSSSRGCDNIHNWRRDNINLLIQEVSSTIKSIKPYVKFGVSPLAIWRNKKQDPNGSLTNSGQSSYDNLYCDTKLWIEENWVDYMAPQLYWSTSNKYANFNHLIDWWTKHNYKGHLYVGHALYKLDKKDRHSFSTDELFKQVNISRENGKVKGNIYFRANAFVKNHQNVQEKMSTSIYKYPSLIPSMPWIDSIPPLGPVKLKTKFKNGVAVLKWKEANYQSANDSAAYFVVYRFDKDEIVNIGLSNKIVSIQKGTEFKDSTAIKGENYQYVVTAVDRLHNESNTFAYAKIK